MATVRNDEFTHGSNPRHPRSQSHSLPGLCCRLPQHCGRDRRRLLHVVLVQAIEQILIGMPRQRPVVERVLREHRGGHIRVMERHMVAATWNSDRYDGRGAKIARRGELRSKAIRKLGVAGRKIDAADAAAAVVKVQTSFPIAAS
jgi:hypothetical protein